MNKRLIFLSFTFFIFVFSFICATQYKVYDIGKATLAKESYATSINDKNQVGGITCSNTLWFIWDQDNAITTIPINLRSSILGIGCPPYINNSGFLSESFSNDHDELVFVVDSKLYLKKDNSDTVVDDDSKWYPQANGYYLRVNNNSEVAGNILGQNGKKLAKYINLKSRIKQILPIKFSCTVTGINDLGEVVGWFQIEAQNIFHSFLWRPESGEYQIIENFRAAAINNNRIIVGSREEQGAFWDNGVVKVLDSILDLKWDMSIDLESIEVINDINNNNKMVGWGKAGQETRALIIERIN